MCLSGLTFIFKYFNFWKITTTLLTKDSKKLWETRGLFRNMKVKEGSQGETAKGFLAHLFLPASPVNYFQIGVSKEK